MLLDSQELEASGEAAENGRQYKCLKYADVIHMLLCGYQNTSTSKSTTVHYNKLQKYLSTAFFRPSSSLFCFASLACKRETSCINWAVKTSVINTLG